MDLLGVVAGDRNLAEQAAEEAGAGLGDLVQGNWHLGKLGEDRQQPGAGRRFEHEVGGGQRCRLGGDKAERDRRRELLQLLGFLGAARLRREPPGEAGQHLDHCGRGAGARTHGGAEFAQEHDLRRFERFIGVLPHPGAIGIAGVERSLHRRAHRPAVDRAALPQELRQQRSGMNEARNLVGRGLRQEQGERGRGGRRGRRHRAWREISGERG